MIKYVQISNDLRNKILNGTFKGNEQLPFEKDLCNEYSASKMTVKKALDNLVSEGLIVKRRGSGTFVKDMSAQDISHLYNANQFRGLTAEYGFRNVSSQILEFNVISSNDEIEKNLNLSKEEFVYNVLRVRQVDNNPHVIEHTYMPINLVTGLTKKHCLASIYEYIEETLKLKIQSANRTITIRKCTDFEQKYLELSEGDPVAVVTQTGFLENGRAFEYSTCVHSYKYFQFKTIMFR